MSYLDNRTILEKADLALADLTAGGGILKPAQAQKFMRLLIKQSVLMQQATVVPMASPKQQISKIKFGSRVLRPGQEATPLGASDRAKPDLSQVELDAKLFKAEVRLSDEVLEDSIERGELRQTIMEMMAEAISRDMEDVLINGDTLSADPFLAVMDGVLKQATSNVVDAGGNPVGNPADFNLSIGYFGAANGDIEGLDPATLPIINGKPSVGWDLNADGLADLGPTATPTAAQLAAGAVSVPFNGYGRVQLRLNPTMTLPDGIMLPLSFTPKSLTYREGKP